MRGGEKADAQPDYVELIFKVARSSLDCDNKVGTDGTRRPDGTLSGQTYDPRPPPPSMSKPNGQVMGSTKPSADPIDRNDPRLPPPRHQAPHRRRRTRQRVP